MILNLRIVARHLGMLLLVLCVLILVVGLFSWLDTESGNSVPNFSLRALLLSAAVSLVISLILLAAARGAPKSLGQREALLLVALSWLIGAGLAAMPFWLWAELRFTGEDALHPFSSYINCYFEAISGLTTTGATVLTQISTIPRSLLLWRALTHWLGGLGIVVLFVAVLPLLGVGGRRVFRIEAPGPAPEGVTPRIQDTARVLWMIYCGLTIVEIVLLVLCGMSVFDAVCHTFATLATGGFSTTDASIAGFASTAINVVVIVFMVLAGVNFSLYHAMCRRQWGKVLRDPELRAYLFILTAASLIVVGSLLRQPENLSAGASDPTTGQIVQHGIFQVVSVQTTTGFCSADFDQWGFTAKAVLLALMFVGGCAGSTGGGIKVVRILIAVKVLWAELEQVYQRRVVRSVQVGKSIVDAELKLNTMIYVLGIVVLFAMGTAGLMLLEQDNAIDITTAATASIATLNNIGPGLARVGATQNYAWFSDGGKAFMCLLMLLGRLEVFTIAVLISPRFWRGD